MPLEIAYAAADSEEGQVCNAIEAVLEGKGMILTLNCVSTVLARAYAQIILQGSQATGTPPDVLREKFLDEYLAMFRESVAHEIRDQAAHSHPAPDRVQ